MYNSGLVSKNQYQISQCPKFSYLGRPCNHRTCVSLSCREQWAKIEYFRLYWANKQLNINLRCRFSLFRSLSIDENVEIMRQVVRRAKKWCTKNGEQFFIKMYPEQTSNGLLHFHGCLRCGKKAEQVLRRAWKNITGKGGGSYSIVEPDYPLGSLAYCVKWHRQHLYQPVISEGKSVMVIIQCGSM
jgi:hypothetical protein